MRPRRLFLLALSAMLALGVAAAVRVESSYARVWGAGHCGPTRILGAYRLTLDYEIATKNHDELKITKDRISISGRRNFTAAYRIENIEPWLFTRDLETRADTLLVEAIA
jgi:hypothetical protein